MYRSFIAALIGRRLVEKPDRNEFDRNVITAVASQSMPPVSRGTFQALTTKQQIERANTRARQAASAAVDAVATVSAKPPGPEKKLTDTEINKLPALSRVARPDLVDKINAVALIADQQVQLAKTQAQTDLAQEAGSLIQKLYEINRGSDGKITIVTLTETDLDVAPELKKIVIANGDLLDKIKTPPVLTPGATAITTVGS